MNESLHYDTQMNNSLRYDTHTCMSHCTTTHKWISHCATTHTHEWVITFYVLIASLFSLLHLECDLNSIFNLNLLGLFSTERGKRDLKRWIIDWDLRMKKRHSKCNRLYVDMNEIPYECGPIWMWSHMNVVPYEWRNDTPNAIGCKCLIIESL